MRNTYDTKESYDLEILAALNGLAEEHALTLLEDFFPDLSLTREGVLYSTGNPMKFEPIITRGRYLVMFVLSNEIRLTTDFMFIDDKTPLADVYKEVKRELWRRFIIVRGSEI